MKKLKKKLEIEKKNEKKLVANLHDKTEYVIHIRNLKQALNNGLVLRKVHRVIKFIQNAWLKPNTDISTDLRKKPKNDFEKDFFKLINNAVFGRRKISYYKVFHITFISNRNEKN